MPGTCTNWHLCGYNDRAAGRAACQQYGRSSHTNASLGPSKTSPAAKQFAPAVITRPRPSAGPQTVIGYMRGDLHRLTIQTLAEADVDVVTDGKVDVLPGAAPILRQHVGLHPSVAYSSGVRHPNAFVRNRKRFVRQLSDGTTPESLVKRYSRRDDFFDRDTFGVTIDASGEALVFIGSLLRLVTVCLTARCYPSGVFNGLGWSLARQIGHHR